MTPEEARKNLETYIIRSGDPKLGPTWQEAMEALDDLTADLDRLRAERDALAEDEQAAQEDLDRLAVVADDLSKTAAVLRHGDISDQQQAIGMDIAVHALRAALGDRAAEDIGESIEDRAKTPRGSAPNWSGTPADAQTPALVDALPNALGDRTADPLRAKDLSAAEHSDTRSECPNCYEWRDSPTADCAACAALGDRAAEEGR